MVEREMGVDDLCAGFVNQPVETVSIPQEVPGSESPIEAKPLKGDPGLAGACFKIVSRNGSQANPVAELEKRAGKIKRRRAGSRVPRAADDLKDRKRL
jgi:hypothetical protein